MGEGHCNVRHLFSSIPNSFIHFPMRFPLSPTCSVPMLTKKQPKKKKRTHRNSHPKLRLVRVAYQRIQRAIGTAPPLWPLYKLVSRISAVSIPKLIWVCKSAIGLDLHLYVVVNNGAILDRSYLNKRRRIVINFHPIAAKSYVGTLFKAHSAPDGKPQCCTWRNPAETRK